MASKAAGRLNPSNAVETEPVLPSSKAMPDPPMMVNQKVVMTGATKDSIMIIDLIDRPREMRAMNMAIRGPYPMNQPQKNTVHQPSQPGSPNSPASPRYSAMSKKLLI